MKKSQFIQTYVLRLGILGLYITGMLLFLLCLQIPPVPYCFKSTGNDTVFSSGGFGSDVAALRGNMRNNNISRTNNFSATANAAATQSDNSVACFRLISNLHNNRTIPLQLNPSCNIIIHTTPTRAGPSFFIA